MGRRTVRYRHSEFLYSKNDQYKIVKLQFFEKQCSEISIDKVYLSLTIKNPNCMTNVRFTIIFVSTLLKRPSE